MSGHNPTERALFTDVSDKNRLAREYRRLSADVHRWRERAAEKVGKRWRKQYSGAVARGEAQLAEMRTELLARAEDLKVRIREEQKISEADVKKYETQYKKEVSELKSARQALADAQDAVDAAAKKASEDEETGAVLAELRAKRWGAAAELRRETQDLKKAAREIDSERRDREVLAYELRRVVAEVEALRG